MRAKTKRERAIAIPHAGVGMTRYQLYRKAWGRVESATEAGYYLEAITLLESILTDRLESRASYLTGRNEGYQNLGPLIHTLRQHESIADFRPIIDRIDAWRERRNEAVSKRRASYLGGEGWAAATDRARGQEGAVRFRRSRQTRASE